LIFSEHIICGQHTSCVGASLLAMASLLTERNLDQPMQFLNLQRRR
jgi:hypothetical protein